MSVDEFVNVTEQTCEEAAESLSKYVLFHCVLFFFCFFFLLCCSFKYKFQMGILAVDTSHLQCCASNHCHLDKVCDWFETSLLYISTTF